MQGQSILNILFDRLIATAIVKEVFHSVIIREVDGARKPMAPVEGSFQFVGVDDTLGFMCYCRTTGPLEFEKEEPFGSCGSKLVWTRIPHKLVFYNDSEDRDHDQLTGILTQAVLGIPEIRLQRVYTIPEQIFQTESNGRTSFTPSTYFTSIDFSLLLKLQPDDCEKEFGCQGLTNPYRT